MIVFDLIYNLLNKLGLFIIIIYLLSMSKTFTKLITQNENSFKGNLLLITIFGIIGVLGNYFSINYEGSLVNTRIIGVASGGLYGGPVVGLGAAVISVLHRLSIGNADFTLKACSISTIIEGIISGYSYYAAKDKQNKWIYGIILGIICESLRKVMVLIFSKPFDKALAVVKVIWIPMTVVNAVGLAIFIAIIDSIFKEKEKLKAYQAKLCLNIANKTLPILRKGLNKETAYEAGKIIYNMTDFDAIAITDTNEVLCHIGVGNDHHLPGGPLLTNLTKKVIQEGVFVISRNKSEIDCKYPACKLQSAIVLPLKIKENVIGTLKLYRCAENSISETDVELGLGLAQLFSTQLELSMIEEQNKILAMTQIKVLQNQINPHFLFNCLNTISILCRLNPFKARKLINHLSNFYRKNLNKKDVLIDIDEELEHVKSYVALEKERFKNKLKILFLKDEKVNIKVPPLTLQPLVENAIQHGILPKENGGNVWVIIKNISNGFLICVKDNGVGIEENLLKRLNSLEFPKSSFGLESVYKRFKYFYNENIYFKIYSVKGKGTSVIIKVRGEAYEGFNC
ncbi:MAG: LytS/YhcK type 5TM receptor domain-containing protein [Thermovenabulum sp.]|uniref:LytS/YhcK type 5TM receptor domain-containing protein n=1 Tax=Thermovenabulum sp. TaxID=3100335 RepID=UPI003C7A82C4